MQQQLTTLLPESVPGLRVLGVQMAPVLAGKSIPTTTIDLNRAYHYGHREDGVIEFAAWLRRDIGRSGARGFFETGYYYGAAKKKNIVKVSSQVGCAMKCPSCNLGPAALRANLTAQEISDQAMFMLSLAAAEGVDVDAVQHKVSFAGSGEPLLNMHLVGALMLFAPQQFSFKISSVLPAGRLVARNMQALTAFAREYEESVQMQVSLISTDEAYRRHFVGARLFSFGEIAEMAKLWREGNPKRSTFNLSLILAEDTPARVEDVARYFPPEHFRFRFRPYVPTDAGKDGGLRTISDERMGAIKSSFQQAGYYVGDDATPTETERAYELASNVTLQREMKRLSRKG